MKVLYHVAAIPHDGSNKEKLIVNEDLGVPNKSITIPTIEIVGLRQKLNMFEKKKRMRQNQTIMRTLRLKVHIEQLEAKKAEYSRKTAAVPFQAECKTIEQGIADVSSGEDDEW